MCQSSVLPGVLDMHADRHEPALRLGVEHLSSRVRKHCLGKTFSDAPAAEGQLAGTGGIHEHGVDPQRALA